MLSSTGLLRASSTVASSFTPHTCAAAAAAASATNNKNKTTMSRPSSSGTFQPLRHRSGTMRDRLHGYTKRTLGAGGSMNEAVREKWR